MALFQQSQLDTRDLARQLRRSESPVLSVAHQTIKCVNATIRVAAKRVCRLAAAVTMIYSGLEFVQLEERDVLEGLELVEFLKNAFDDLDSVIRNSFGLISVDRERERHEARWQHRCQRFAWLGMCDEEATRAGVFAYQ